MDEDAEFCAEVGRGQEGVAEGVGGCFGGEEGGGGQVEEDLFEEFGGGEGCMCGGWGCWGCFYGFGCGGCDVFEVMFRKVVAVAASPGFLHGRDGGFAFSLWRLIHFYCVQSSSRNTQSSHVKFEVFCRTDRILHLPSRRLASLLRASLLLAESLANTFTWDFKR